jgi:hypothetical protein
LVFASSFESSPERRLAPLHQILGQELCIRRIESADDGRDLRLK